MVLKLIEYSDIIFILNAYKFRYISSFTKAFFQDHIKYNNTLGIVLDMFI